MCGFAGQVNLDGLKESPEQRKIWLRAMGRQLSRRGPDDEQFYQDDHISLVFRRLSIIDLEGGQQPLWNENRSVLAAVNGEIYNHQEIRKNLIQNHSFSSQSDSEVIVHLYEDHGARLMQELNGMFAFIVWDTKERRLLLARDRLGIKPLFYAMVGNSLIFASELKALLAHPDCPRKLDWHDFEQPVSNKGGLQTYIQDVQQLPGGHYITAGPGKSFSISNYWSIEEYFPTAESCLAKSAQTYSDEYGELLHDSVQKRLMSDVPLGLFLSGGIDSTLLAAMAADTQKEMHCFTVVEQTTLDAGDVEQAQRACEKLNLNYYPVRYDARTLLQELDFSLENFEYLIWAVETPGFNMEWLLKHELHAFVKTRLPDLKVILLGQGADEFAGGYSQSMGTENQSWRLYQDRLSLRDLEDRRIEAGIPAYMVAAIADDYPLNRQPRKQSLFHNEMQQRTTALQNYNLWHEDRTSSCNGIEARVPFLDHRLVELLASVPEHLHDSLFFNKSIVRDQLVKSLPSYPRDKLKVKFFETGKGSSIKALKIEIIRRIFSVFKTKYLDQNDAIFSAQKMTHFYKLLAKGAKPSNRELSDFISCMAISVFDRFCSDVEKMDPGGRGQYQSPLRLWK